MPREGPAKLLRIVTGERDRHEHRPLYAAVVELLRSRQIAGASVFRGVEGYGSHAVVHAARLLDLSSDLPIVIEAVDDPARIAAVLPELRVLAPGALITLQDVEIVGGAEHGG